MHILLTINCLIHIFVRFYINRSGKKTTKPEKKSTKKQYLSNIFGNDILKIYFWKTLFKTAITISCLNLKI